MDNEKKSEKYFVFFLFWHAVCVFICVVCMVFDVCCVLCFSRIQFSKRDECIFSFARLKNRIDFDEVRMMYAACWFSKKKKRKKHKYFDQ